jgi:glycosyltransferase involved in cell wall biosynthesis
MYQQGHSTVTVMELEISDINKQKNTQASDHVKVSVLMITYNHESYISQAIESVLAQETDFQYELVIGEDCSKDNTRAIIANYQKAHPQIIKLLPSESNLGTHRNFLRTYKACQGKYIALLEGDDYWSAPDKLQKQVDFLDAHSDFTICFHNVLMSFEDDPQKNRDARPSSQKEISTIEDVFKGKFIPTCSVMFQNGLFSDFPDWVYSLTMTDWLLDVLNARYGSIKYINEVMGVYRVHSGGVWSSIGEIEHLKADIQFLTNINEYLNFEFDHIIQQTLDSRWAAFAETLIENAKEQESSQIAIEQTNDFTNELDPPPAWKSTLLSNIYASFAFQNYAEEKFPLVRKNWVNAIRYNPSWLINRGMLAIGIRAFFSPKATSWVQK